MSMIDAFVLQKLFKITKKEIIMILKLNFTESEI